MFHFIKYLLLAAFFFVVLNLFRSNMGEVISLKFNVPFVADWKTIPIDFNYWVLASFCVGILFAAFAGAFRMGAGQARSREVKRLQRELEEAQTQNRSLLASNTARSALSTDPLPPLAP